MHDPNWRPEALVPEKEVVGSDDYEPSLVGSEIPFPFDIRELEQQYGPNVKRPRLLNYYFTKVDLISGPTVPDDFVDEFCVELENQDDNHRWTSTYTIATPKGLSNLLARDGYRYVYGDGMIIVPRYDLSAILRAVLELHFDAGPKPERLESDETSS
jgi:hypothetical protein